MRWVEKPVHTEDMQDVPEEKRLHFDKVGGYTEGAEGFSAVMQSQREGDEVEVTVWRGGTVQRILVRLAGLNSGR